jgi:hypothetical protein
MNSDKANSVSGSILIDIYNADGTTNNYNYTRNLNNRWCLEIPSDNRIQHVPRGAH